jgi:isoquinoline 1-oxidoreductase beta subunit
MPRLKRRHFILGSLGAVGALGIGWASLPARQRLVPGKPLDVAPGQVALNGWVKLSADGTVTIMMSQAEMGQGIHTGLAMVLADEMDADWSRVRLEQATLDPIYNNQAVLMEVLPSTPDGDGFGKRAGRHVIGRLVREMPGMISTGGSSSMRDQFMPMRRAGAAARQMLLTAAASAWQVPPGECAAASGMVVHRSGKKLSYGELAERAAKLPVPMDASLKSPEQFRLIGKPVHRIDGAAKISGAPVYALDATPPGLLYASVVLCPTLGGSVGGVDSRAAAAVPGVRKIVTLPPLPGGLLSTGTVAGGVAVIADAPYQAMRAVGLLEVRWEHGANAALSSDAIGSALAAGVAAEKPRVHYEHGDVAGALAAAATTIHADYEVPLLAHATMEPMNCTVQFKDGAATVWCATQTPAFARTAVAQALGIKEELVTLEIPSLGGGFGRRYYTDVIAQAALLARETDGRPVQLLWPREEDMTHDFYRPAFRCRATAGFDAAGRLTAWQTVSAGSSLGQPSLIDSSTDGASTLSYAFASSRIAHQQVESGVTMGIWRSVAHSQNAFFTECFVDECATAARRDPLAFRADLLKHSPRHLAVLERVSELARWSEALPKAPDGATIARGIALHQSFGSIVGQVAEVSIGPARQIRVHKVWCVVDCGIAINPNLVRQQVEGAIVFGLSAALHGEITLVNGQVQQRNFDTYAPLRINEAPQIETEIIASAEPPGGIGEVGTPPIAPAVANALFVLTRERLRRLPLRLPASEATT